jgi:hypothetical protein
VPNTCEGAPDASCACIKVATDGDDVSAAASGGVLPFANVAPAIDYAAAHAVAPTKVCVAQGAACGSRASYPGPNGADLAMRNGISVYGDYESSGWSRCAERGTTLAPGTGSGVYFGPAVTSPTVLDRFVIARFPAETTAAVTLDGTHGAVVSNVDVGSAALGATTTYGIDAKNDADATLSRIIMTPTQLPDGTLWSPPNQVGIRAVASSITVTDSDLTLLATMYSGGHAESVTGLWLESVPSSAVIDTSLDIFSYVPAVGIHASNVPELALDGTSVGVRLYESGGTDFSAATFNQAPGLSWQDGALTVTAPYIANGLELLDSAEATLDLDVTITGGHVVRGIALLNSPGAELQVAASVRGGDFGAIDGIYVTGDARDTVLAGSLTATLINRGVTIDGCSDTSPVVRTNVSTYASAIVPGRVEGVSVSGACAPTISASASIHLCDEYGGCGYASSGMGPQVTLTAIHCRAPSRCTIDHSGASVVGGATPYGTNVASYGIACDSGACPTITNTSASALSEVLYQGSARYEGGGIIAPGAELIARNVVSAGCTGRAGVGLAASTGRIENNVITGPTCGANRYDGVSRAVGLSVTGRASVHSNTIDAGGATDCLPPLCTGYGWQGCDGTGVSDGIGAEYTNNIVVSTRCTQRSAFWMPAPPTQLGPILRHNALSMGSYEPFSVAYVRYGNGSPPVTSPLQLMSLTGVSGTVFDPPLLDAAHRLQEGSPCIDSGSPLGAPPTDREGDPRDESPDIGADEWTGAPSACRGIDCSEHGVCRNGACVCDPTYLGEHCEAQNQCAIDNGGCDPLTTCTGTATEHVCGPCPAGYTGDGATGCTDIDECATEQDDCVGLLSCVNQPGSFTCVCPPGYRQFGGSCDDIDECQTNNGDCDPLTVCTNVPGSRTCGACPSGFAGSGEAGCTDIDECSTNNGGCSSPALCEKLPGTSTCVCPPGYTGTPETGCVNTNECASDHGGCDPLTTCTDTPGGRTCGACPAGYYGTGEMGCSATCPCEHGGVCTVPEGEYTCACPPTFAGSRCEIAFVSVATGSTHACGVRSDGQIVCWGSDTDGSLSPPPGPFSAVAAGLVHTCGVHADTGAIECWGRTTRAPPSGAFTALAAAWNYNVAIAADGTLAVWVSLGTGSMAAPPAGTFKQVAGSVSRFCAIGTDDLVRCFGESDGGMPFGGPAISVGDGYGTCAVMADGSITCLGNGWGITPLPPDGAFKAVSVGSAGACAIASDDTLVCFGGDGTITTAPTGTFKSVSVSATYACAIATDERLTCWGTDPGFGVLTPPY